ncbi:MAG: hypothetical protein ACYSVY_11305 [Planctomycetota bacterium]
MSSPTKTLMSVGLAEMFPAMGPMKRPIIPKRPPNCVFEQSTNPLGSIMIPVISESVS